MNWRTNHQLKIINLTDLFAVNTNRAKVCSDRLKPKNTDNLKEEIQRGMTINIGFAHLNQSISLIDVPGHERFVKNMVAGVSSIDFAVLVVAADDGGMPQTIEHFNIFRHI